MEYYNKIVINGIEYPLEAVIVGGGVPTEATAANIGQLYANSADSFCLYICTAKSSSGLTTWQKAVSPINEGEIATIIGSIT